MKRKENSKSTGRNAPFERFLLQTLRLCFKPLGFAPKTNQQSLSSDSLLTSKTLLFYYEIYSIDKNLEPYSKIRSIVKNGGSRRSVRKLNNLEVSRRIDEDFVGRSVGYSIKSRKLLSRRVKMERNWRKLRSENAWTVLPINQAVERRNAALPSSASSSAVLSFPFVHWLLSFSRRKTRVVVPHLPSQRKRAEDRSTGRNDRLYDTHRKSQPTAELRGNAFRLDAARVKRFVQ